MRPRPTAASGKRQAASGLTIAGFLAVPALIAEASTALTGLFPALFVQRVLAANGTYSIAAQTGPVTVAAVLAHPYPVVTALCALALLKERLRAVQAAGAGPAVVVGTDGHARRRTGRLTRRPSPPARPARAAAPE